MNSREVMLAVLAVLALGVLLSLIRAHRRTDVVFSLLDLLVENGRVSKIAVAFMLVLVVTTWTVVFLTVRDKLTEGYFLAYGAMWVGPLVAKVVFNKSDMPSTSSTTTVMQQTTEVSKP